MKRFAIVFMMDSSVFVGDRGVEFTAQSWDYAAFHSGLQYLRTFLLSGDTFNASDGEFSSVVLRWCNIELELIGASVLVDAADRNCTGRRVWRYKLKLDFFLHVLIHCPNVTVRRIYTLTLLRIFEIHTNMGGCAADVHDL